MLFGTCILKIILITLISKLKIITGVIPRPRGVSLINASLYVSRADGTWSCLDGAKIIKFGHINDNYCDCNDSSDEPGTSACSSGYFYCDNIGHKSRYVPSSRVNDGICDCCDGTDEYLFTVIKCANICNALGIAEIEQQRNEKDLLKRGAKIREDMIVQGKLLKTAREKRHQDLEKRLLEQNILKLEKDQFKRQAEAAESAALELYNTQQDKVINSDVNKILEDISSTELEEKTYFLRYDKNKNGILEISEIQADTSLDRNYDGIVDLKEAQYYFDVHKSVDLEIFISTVWPRIKSIQMLEEGLFKAPMPRHQMELSGRANNLAGKTSEEEDTDGNTSGEEIEEDADVGIAETTEENVSKPDYDSGTQKIIDLANAARSAYLQVEQEIRDIETKMKEIENEISKDYGQQEEYASLDGKCYSYEDREYVYTFCPFDRISQKPRDGGADTTLGRWSEWIVEDKLKYAKHRYSHGTSCWNGPQRSVVVHLKCGLENKINDVSEPNRCEYFFEFETPASCAIAEYEINVDSHDEL